ncbi:MAG: hypothetical protein AAB432_01970 [Patescibacteria group bacterium]
MAFVFSKEVLIAFAVIFTESVVFGFFMALFGRFVTIVSCSKEEQKNIVSWRDWIRGCAIIALAISFQTYLLFYSSKYIYFMACVAVTIFIGTVFGGLPIIRRPLKTGKILEKIINLFQK